MKDDVKVVDLNLQMPSALLKKENDIVLSQSVDSEPLADGHSGAFSSPRARYSIPKVPKKLLKESEYWMSILQLIRNRTRNDR